MAYQRELTTQVDWLPKLPQLLLLGSGLSGTSDLKRQIAELFADRAFLREDELPRTAEAFAARRSDAAERIAGAVQDVLQILTPLFTAYHQARLAVEGATNPQWAYAVADIKSQLEQLTAGRFLLTTPWPWLGHLPRYLRAIQARLEKLSSGGLAPTSKTSRCSCLAGIPT